MLSRTGRSAAVLIMTQAALLVMFPAPASSTVFSGCPGGPGPHACCSEAYHCNHPGHSGNWCCFFEDDGKLAQFCACEFAT